MLFDQYFNLRLEKSQCNKYSVMHVVRNFKFFGSFLKKVEIKTVFNSNCLEKLVETSNSLMILETIINKDNSLLWLR